MLSELRRVAAARPARPAPMTMTGSVLMTGGGLGASWVVDAWGIVKKRWLWVDLEVGERKEKLEDGAT